jgi:hypothetical protein
MVRNRIPGLEAGRLTGAVVAAEQPGEVSPGKRGGVDKIRVRFFGGGT